MKQTSLKTSLLKRFVIGLFFGFSSCNLGVAHTDFVSLDNGVWEKDHPLEFKIIPKDTTLAYNWYIQLRTNQDYPYSNLFLITELSSEQGIEIDTINYTTANPDGSWRGTPSGSLIEHKIPYQSQRSLSGTGTYTLRIRQAMRALGSVEPLKRLEGVTDVGYSIEIK